MINKYDQMYMDIAVRVSNESKCPRRQVGCCILLDSGLISVGFNGMASGGKNEWEWKADGDPEVIHAEFNGVGKLLAQGVSCKGATVYLTLSPCLQCAKLLELAKVKRVVYLKTYRCTEGIDYLKKYNIQTEKYGEDVHRFFPKYEVSKYGNYPEYHAVNSERGGQRYDENYWWWNE